jgi:hypothetical protein
MTNNLAFGVIAAASDVAVVTVTSDTNSAFSFGTAATAYHIWNTDGTRDEKDNSNAAIQILASTDWIIPNSAASSSYRIRHTSATGDTGNFTPAGSINVWLSFSSQHLYSVVDNSPTAGGNSVTYNIQIDDGGGTALDSANQTLTADREDF